MSRYSAAVGNVLEIDHLPQPGIAHAGDSLGSSFWSRASSGANRLSDIAGREDWPYSPMAAA